MNVSLTAELEEFISRKVESGRYTSASEVVREALRLLEERDQLQALKREELRAEIRAGLESGPSTVWNAEAAKSDVQSRLGRTRKKRK